MPSATKQTPNLFLRNRLLRDASMQAVYDAMRGDASVHLFGEGARVKVHYDAPKIEADFLDRVHTLPISEDGNTNFCVGAALAGVKPIVDVISADFLYRTMDSICNTAAKLDFVSRREHTIVVRAEFLLGGPTTGQRPEAMLAHVPGLRVVIPSTPRDSYGMMRRALETPGVTVFFEDRMIADDGFFADGDLYYDSGDRARFGRISWRVRDPSAGVTVLAYGLMRQRAEAAIRMHNLRANLYDLRSIAPLDIDGILDAVRRTGKLLIVEPDVVRGGVGAEIAAVVAEHMPGTAIRRLGAPFRTIPASMALHDSMLPSEEEIADAIRRSA